jgi:hypothetical protein
MRLMRGNTDPSFVNGANTSSHANMKVIVSQHNICFCYNVKLWVTECLLNCELWNVFSLSLSLSRPVVVHDNFEYYTITALERDQYEVLWSRV